MSAERILIVGLGGTGTSLGLALRDQGAWVEGYDRDPEAARNARAGGAVDALLESPEAIDPATSVVALALPPEEAVAILPRLGAALPPRAILTDGSMLMLPSLAAASSVPSLPPRFVPAHAMPAGESPPGGGEARADRFRGATVFFGVPIEAGTSAARVADLWRSVGADPLVLAPPLHDALVALTHQLPLLASAALVRTLRRAGNMTLHLAKGAGPTLRSATAPAAAIPSRRARALALNAPKLLPALNLLEREVRELRRALETGGPELEALLAEASAFRAELTS